MKKVIYIFLFVILSAHFAYAENIDYQEMDKQSRANASSGSLMFKRNADQYRQLSDAEKKEIEARREQAKKYREEQEKMAKLRAEVEAKRKAAEQEAKKRAEELKPITLYEDKLKIYALVNGEIISSNDMQSRINAFILTTGIPYNKNTSEMIKSKVLQSAIDEKIKIQEAKKNNINVSQAEITSAVKDFEKMNNIPQNGLKNILDNAKVSMNVWTKQIEADIAWKKLISHKGFSQISIGEADINKALADIKNDMKIKKYMLSEIVIDQKDAKNIEKLVENLRQDPRFELYAMQFSQSPSAANGGHLGWIIKGQLSPTLENVVFKMSEGEISNPIAFGKDYYIYKLEKIYNPNTDTQKLPTKQEIKKFLENKKLEEYASKYIKELRSHALIEKKL